ncbi:MAG: hypothetical protein IT513_05275 [Burkholderiales bacterium]|nr:hypothetical protein [Burkholderiales bacterium]
MIFGLFGKRSRVAREPTRIWRTWNTKIDRVAAEAVAAERVLVVAHFRVFVDGIQKALEHHGKAARVYTDAFGSVHLGSAAGLGTAQGVAVALTRTLPAPKAAAPTDDPELLVLVAGHHFLSSEDERIAAWCEGLGVPVRLRFHDSLQSALLGMFNVANIAPMLEKLGMTDDEAIEHSYVDGAIRNAQKRTASVATGSRAADSPEEWMRLNLPAQPPGS